MFFVYSGIDQLIRDIDYTRKKFYFYDLEKFAVKLNLTIEQARLCILAVYIKFVLDKDLNSCPKFLCASKNKVLEFKANYKIEFEKRKQIIYDVIDKVRHLITGNENSVQYTRIISTALGVNKTDTVNFYNMIMRSPVLTSEGEVVIYPQKASLTKSLILDVRSKELVCFYSMGYIDDELFYLINKCTNHTFSIKAPRADSIESDNCIMNFLVPRIQKLIYKVCLITHMLIEKINEIEFNMRLQNGNLVEIRAEAEPIKLLTLQKIKQVDEIGFYHCLNEFCTALINKNDLQEIDKSFSLSENELIFYAYLNLLDDLKYINLKEKKVLILGAGLVKGGRSKFEEESLLFFELLKLGIIKGEQFQPSNIENINLLTVEELSLGNLRTYNSIESNSNEYEDELPTAQSQFYQLLRHFENFSSLQRSLTLYQIESSIDKVLQTIQLIKTELRKENLSNYQLLSTHIDRSVRERIYVINRLVSSLPSPILTTLILQSSQTMRPNSLTNVLR